MLNEWFAFSKGSEITVNNCDLFTEKKVCPPSLLLRRQIIEMSSKKTMKVESNCLVLSSEARDDELIQNRDTGKNSDSKKRKLHKTYIKGWSEEISNTGFASCMIASCNFISSNILEVQKHYKSCSGVSLSGKNLCGSCGCFLPTSEELVQHKAICGGANKAGVNWKNSDSAITDKSIKMWKSNVKTLNQACNNPGCSFLAKNSPDLEEHRKTCSEVPSFSLFCCIHCRCGFSTKEEHIKHQQNCSVSSTTNTKKADNLHFRVIKQMKNKDSSDDHIIQPGPDLPKGQYRRRRAYRAEHKNSWALTLEKFKYVKCIYQNCYFIAMSLEDMIAHFGYCNGDGSFAKFVCPYCNGRVTSEAILLKHIERSHTLESAPIKVEPLIDKNGDECLNSHLQIHDSNETNLENDGSHTEESFSLDLSTRKNMWSNEIRDSGMGFCRNSLCNFMAPRIQDLEIHLRTCDGRPDFELFNCQKCQHRLPTEEDLDRHGPVCCYESINQVPVTGGQNAYSRPRGVEEDDLEIGPVVRQYKSKRPRSYSKQRKATSVGESQSENSSFERSFADISVNEIQNSSNPSKKQRGRPKKIKEEPKKLPEEEDATNEEKVTCAKCQFSCTKSAFVYHNLKKHYGLAWLEGEEPVDLNDDKLVVRLVKNAFKYTKKAACEKCDVVKRSVMGFVSHVQICGKSEEEKDALRAQCPHCGGKYLRYSLAAHIKLSHSGPEGEEEEEEQSEAASELSGKRRSAIKAVTKFQQVLSENEEAELNVESHYILYERGSERIPKLNSKLNNLWYKLKRENKKIPCRHPNCTNLSTDVKEAKNHHYTCPFLPEKVFLCELCDFYSVDEHTVKSHLSTHRKYLKVRKTSGEEEVKLDEGICENEEEEHEQEEDMEEDEEEEVRSSEEELDDLDEPKKQKRKKTSESKMRKKMKFSIDMGKPDLDVEIRLKQNFCRREKIDNIRGIQFYSNGLEMTLQEEAKILGSSELWPELHTTLEDWTHVPLIEATPYLPLLAKSVPVRFSGEESVWRTFDRFDGDLIGGVPVMFTGASVRSMSWCKISFKRMMEKTQRQFLAVTTAGKLDHLKDIYEKLQEESSLLQIWDCGALDNDLAKTAPKFTFGIVQNGGEIWDVAWFPQDAFSEATEKRLRRLGLLATACEDGNVRIWSICDPDHLGNTKGLPVYRTEPVAMLVADNDMEESCFKLSVGLDGVIAGGFGNGTIAVWNVKNVSSPFCKKLEKCSIIRAHLVFQAHKTAVTGLTFCPSNSRYISTAGLDRFVKVWDLEFPSVPIEQSNKEYSLDNIWTLNWPSLIYNFDDVVINLNKGVVKFIKDILTDRHQSTLAMEDTCLSLSFSDWLNALCGGSITGEVKLRLLKNLIHDQKRSQSTISTVRLERLEGFKDCENAGEEVDIGRDFPRTYNEVAAGFGLVFKDSVSLDKKKPEKPKAHPEEFPIRAVNKIAFNPNFKCFTHIALGYNCGLIRILPLREVQSTKSLKFFLEKAQKGKF